MVAEFVGFTRKKTCLSLEVTISGIVAKTNAMRSGLHPLIADAIVDHAASLRAQIVPYATLGSEGIARQQCKWCTLKFTPNSTFTST